MRLIELLRSLPPAQPVPFWHFWNPWSGAPGGLILMALIFTLLEILDRLGVF